MELKDSDIILQALFAEFQKLSTNKRTSLGSFSSFYGILVKNENFSKVFPESTVFKTLQLASDFTMEYAALPWYASRKKKNLLIRLYQVKLETLMVQVNENDEKSS